MHLNLKRILYSRYVDLIQRSVITESGKKIKYIFKKQNNDNNLMVVFSAFSDPPAKFNYIRTLKNLKTNKLFILDEWGRSDYPGVYYLGEHGDYSLKEEIIKFINHIVSDIGSNCQISTLGSSKGGWCALYYGMRLSANTIIAGAPQYYLGNYLDCEFHQKTFNIMTGDDIGKDKDTLNNLLPELIANYKNKIIIYLHFSDSEHTYFSHIKNLYEDLVNNDNFHVVADIQHYRSHGDVGEYFSTFVKEVLKLS